MGLLYKVCNPFGMQGHLKIWSVWILITYSYLFAFALLFWILARRYYPSFTPTTHFYTQAKVVGFNFLLLSMVQGFWDCVASQFPISKMTVGDLNLYICVRDVVYWAFCFELSWYTQHRLMHDVKFLWVNAHGFHHTWRRPEHMIGITSFAFDHIVEVWATMSSSFFGYLIFPINAFVGKSGSLVYMVLAVLSHWDGFHLSRYHINHHYLVTKNYGSHIPLFDIFFNTYQWEPYEHPESAGAANKAGLSEAAQLLKASTELKAS